MEIDAEPRRTYCYVLDLRGFSPPTHVSVVNDWTLMWTCGLAKSQCALHSKKSEISLLKQEFQMCVFSVTFSGTAQRVHGYTPALLGERRPHNYVLRKLEEMLITFSMTNVIFDQVFRRNHCRSRLCDNECNSRACDTHSLVRKSDGSGDRDESDKEDARFPEELDFEASDRTCSHDGHLKVSRGDILLLNLLVQQVYLLDGCCIAVSVNMRAASNGHPGFLLSLWQSRMAETRQSKTQLVERNSVFSRSQSWWVYKGSSKVEWKLICNALLNLSLFLFPVFELSRIPKLTLLGLYFSFSFSFGPTSSHLEDRRPSLALFPPRSSMSMQLLVIAQMDYLHVFF